MPGRVRTALAGTLAWLFIVQGARAELPVIEKGTLTICSAVNRPPMAFFSTAQQPEGVDVDLGRLLASRLGLAAKFVNVPFAGLIPALQAGHCDVIMAQLFIKPARLKVIDEIPYMVSHLDYLLVAGKPRLRDAEDLSGQKVAAVNGTTSVDVLNQANLALAAAGKRPITIVVFPESTAALQQLEFGQVDAFAVAYETGLYYSTLDPARFELGAAPCCEIRTGIGIMKTAPALEAALTVTLHGLMKDGSYAALFQKWHLRQDMLAE